MSLDLAEPGAGQTVLAQLPDHLLWRANARVLGLLRETLPRDVDIHAYAVLLALADGIPRSQQSLAETVAISRTTMAKVAGDLVEQGLVQRVRNSADRRSYALTSNHAAAGELRRWERHVGRLETAVTAPYSAEEAEAFRVLLLAIVRPELAANTPAQLLETMCFLISRAHFLMHRDLRAMLEPLKIEPRHVGVLTSLCATGPIPQADLARSLGVSGASVVRMVDDLERRGLVERRRLTTDRRCQMLHLPSGAEAILVQARTIVTEAVAIRFSGLTKGQTRRVVEMLVRFIA